MLHVTTVLVIDVLFDILVLLQVRFERHIDPSLMVGMSVLLILVEYNLNVESF